MNIPGLGKVVKGEYPGQYYSKRISIPVLGGKKCCFDIEGYDEDKHKDEFHDAIRNFIALKKEALRVAEVHVYQYYKDMEEFWKSYDEDFKPIKSPKDVWKHVHLGSSPVVSRRPRGDKGIYISLECGCDWEEEHGMQIVFKNGRQLNKVGPFDGHLTNSDSWGNKRYENVIYKA
jgi:hypothetical protein